MAQVELVMPKMGESIMEATILKWLKNVGDTVEMDEAILEIATDKVDSEVPSPEAGVISEIRYSEGDTVEIGKTIAVINTNGEITESTPAPAAAVVEAPKPVASPAAVTATASAAAEVETTVSQSAPASTDNSPASGHSNGTGRFYSPLVLNIARSEGISMTELEALPGTGKDDRVTKKDILAYVANRQSEHVQAAPAVTPNVQAPPPAPQAAASKEAPKGAPSVSGNVEIIEMDRMRKIIAKHMIESKHTSAHVTSFVEADVTNMVRWRDRMKDEFMKREGQKLTFTPLFIEAVVKAIKDFPMINCSIDGDYIILKKDINIGMATALDSGNLIVPVIKNADRKNLVGLAAEVNELVNKARRNKLNPDDIQGGTFTLSNVGTFGNLSGTPIINQPQVAVLATGAIKKKPAVLETPEGDVIAIRHMMFLSLSYDHRIVDGYLGGSYLRKVADYLEQFDPERGL